MAHRHRVPDFARRPVPRDFRCLHADGIAAVIDIPAPSVEIAWRRALLDAVQDAGNVGAILRTAAAAGVPMCCWVPVVPGPGRRASARRAGCALFAGNPRAGSIWPAALANCSAMAIGTVADGGKSLYELDLTGPTVWMVGNEGAGLSAKLTAAGWRLGDNPACRWY
jgi:TrmH family RNA methyltransferase